MLLPEHVVQRQRHLHPSRTPAHHSHLSTTGFNGGPGSFSGGPGSFNGGLRSLLFLSRHGVRKSASFHAAQACQM